MAEETSSHLIFVDMSIGSHLALLIPPLTTVADLKQKLSVEHATCFSDVGDIKITAVKVKRRGAFYHLSDSILVNDVFHGVKGHWFLNADAFVVKDEDLNICGGVTSIVNADSDRILEGNTCVDVNGTGFGLEEGEELKVGLDQNSDKEMEGVREDELNNIGGDKSLEMHCGKVVNSPVSDNWLDNVVTRTLSSLEKSNENKVADVNNEQLNEAGFEENGLLGVNDGLMAEKDGFGEAIVSLEDDHTYGAFVVEPRKIKRKKIKESVLEGSSKDEFFLRKEHENVEGVIDEHEPEPKSNVMELRSDDLSEQKLKKRRKKASDRDESQELRKNFKEKDAELENNGPAVHEGQHGGDEINKLVVNESNAETMDCPIEAEGDNKIRAKKKSARISPLSNQKGTNDEEILSESLTVVKKSKRVKKDKQNKEIESDKLGKGNEINDEMNTQPTFGAVVDFMINELIDFPTETCNLQVDQESNKSKKSKRKSKTLSGISGKDAIIASPTLPSSTHKQVTRKDTKKHMYALKKTKTTEKDESLNCSSSGESDNIGSKNSQ